MGLLRCVEVGAFPKVEKHGELCVLRRIAGLESPSVFVSFGCEIWSTFGRVVREAEIWGYVATGRFGSVEQMAEHNRSNMPATCDKLTK